MLLRPVLLRELALWVENLAILAPTAAGTPSSAQEHLGPLSLSLGQPARTRSAHSRVPPTSYTLCPYTVRFSLYWHIPIIVQKPEEKSVFDRKPTFIPPFILKQLKKSCLNYHFPLFSLPLSLDLESGLLASSHWKQSRSRSSSPLRHTRCWGAGRLSLALWSQPLTRFLLCYLRVLLRRGHVSLPGCCLCGPFLMPL